jgi:class 3 adenylate cyclase
MTSNLENRIKILERETKLLNKKLMRSEANRSLAENMRDQTDTLYRSVIDDLEATKAMLAEKNEMLEALSGKLSKYLSPQIYRSIFEGGQDVSLKTSRKKLTVFFSDLKDFTSTTEDLQPEDLTYLINRYFSEMSSIALEYGATIDKFIGDAMVLFFGDPESLGVKDDASACVRMAVAMQNRMKELQHMWLEKGYERPFFMRIGINTGYCNVGNFGSPQRMDYTIIGGEVNLAARLESQAEPGGILMSYETYALAKDFIEAEERSPIRVRGIAREIRPFAVTNIYDAKLSERKFIRKDRYGLKLLADLERLKGDDRQAAIEDLQDVIRSLQSDD